ncbi:MarR family transcriptional regulator [Amphritea sp. 1_MG-2023]|uniref:MarR family winged helix-turn-helix transcriptional regulator n=1 Tax=Amphritea sp. 1_MG-2023 TaxID=3062670 RepID=UPI0026E130A8|nr:MarR family transcriptional regulator [Amphritea sp. 1_MG-2023]MDO6561798.1 MarR family transcriptional regulator [Amphritea sp. 1_MG-2023]
MSDQSSLESLFHLVHGLKRQLHQQTEQLNLGITPMHIRVIKIIHRKKPCTAIDIASFLGRDKAQVTRLVNTLIERGFISRMPNPNDKRSHYLCPTDAGIAVIKEIIDIDAKTVQTMTEGLTSEELTEFQRISSIMANNLHPTSDSH